MALHFVSYGFVVWWTSLCWKLQLKENFEKLRRRTTVFTSTDIQLRTSFFFVTSLPWTHGLRTDWFFGSLQLQTGCHFWQMWRTCTSYFFWTLVFTGSLEGKLHQGHFLSTKGFLLGSHSSRENIFAVGVTLKSSRTWGPSETTSILRCEISSFDWEDWRTDSVYRTSTW